MATNLAIDDKLLNKALKLSALKTKKDAVNLALREFIERREQKKILKSLGTIEFRDDWDPKLERRRNESRR